MEVEFGNLRGLPYRNISRKMNHGITGFLGENFAEAFSIEYIEDAQTLRIHVMPVPARQVVDHGHVVTLLDKKLDGMRADVSGAACDENSAGLWVGQQLIVVAWQVYAKRR